MRKIYYQSAIILLTLIAPCFAANVTEDGASAVDSGTDWNGTESNSLANGGGKAETSFGSSTPTSQIIITYGATSIPSGSTIDGITVRDDGWYTSDGADTCGTRTHRVKLSWNSGTNYTAQKATANMTTTETTYTLGTGTTDLWGHTWLQTEMGTTFRLNLDTRRATCVTDGLNTEGITQDTDYLTRTVYYTAPATSSDQILLGMSAKFCVWVSSILNNLGFTDLGEIVFFMNPLNKKEVSVWKG